MLEMSAVMLSSRPLHQHQRPHHHAPTLPPTGAAAVPGTSLSHGSIVCPVADEFHQWKMMHSELVPLRVQDAYKLVFVQEKFMIDVMAGRKADRYVASPWNPDPEGGTHNRTITYTITLGSIGLKSANSTETQILSTHNRAGEAYVVACEVSNEGVPLSDNFSIQLHTCLLRASPPEDTTDSEHPHATDWCRYSCYARIKYKKSVWGVLKGQLERSAYSGMEGVHKDVGAALREYAASEPSPHRVNSSTLQTRRKRRTKTASTDLSSRGRKIIRTEEINWSPVLVNSIFLLLLFALVFVNALLYLRVAGLELLVADDRLLHGQNQPSPYTFSSQEQTANSLKDLVKRVEGGGVWVQVSRILEKQEKLYYSELEDMGAHLSKAASALDKVDSELQQLLDRLPKTMELILSKLKQQEEARESEGQAGQGSLDNPSERQADEISFDHQSEIQAEQSSSEYQNNTEQDIFS